MVDRPVVANLDFDDIKQDIVGHFQSREEFKDYDFTGSSLNLLIDILAYNTHYNSLAANFLVNEMFLDSAIKRDSIVSIAKHLNYTPRSAASARAFISFEVDAGAEAPNTMSLPVGSAFTSRSGDTTFTFYTLREHTITRTDGTYEFVNVEVAEGSLVEQRFIANGSAGTNFERFELLNNNIDTTTVRVQVGGISYQLISDRDDILDITGDSFIYFVEEIRGQQHRIYFGNNILGRRLERDEPVEVSYLVTNGSSGNGISNFEFAGTVTDTSGKSYTNTIIGDVIPANGGDIPETIREIKENAPRYFGAQNRAVTTRDYEALIRSNFANTQSVSVWGGEDNVPVTYGSVFISVKPKIGDKLSDTAKLQLVNDVLNDFNVATVRPQVVDPNIIRIIVKSTVLYDPNTIVTDASTIRAKVYTLLEDYNTSYVGQFLLPFRASRFTRDVAILDTSITSSNTRYSLRFDLSIENQLIQNGTFDFSNRLYNPYRGYNEAGGGIITSAPFRIIGEEFDSFFDDDGAGNIRIYRFIGDTKVYTTQQAGIINYATGEITIFTTNAATQTELRVEATDNTIKFIAVPDSFDVNAERNYLLEIATDDSIVNVISENDLATIEALNTTRRA